MRISSWKISHNVSKLLRKITNKLREKTSCSSLTSSERLRTTGSSRTSQMKCRRSKLRENKGSRIEF